MMSKKLKPKHSITEKEATEDLKRQFIRHPRFQSKVRISASQAAGGTTLGWYRGHHAGIHSAYLTLKKDYKEAAEALLEAYGMDKKGNIGW